MKLILFVIQVILLIVQLVLFVLNIFDPFNQWREFTFEIIMLGALILLLSLIINII